MLSCKDQEQVQVCVLENGYFRNTSNKEAFRKQVQVQDSEAGASTFIEDYSYYG